MPKPKRKTISTKSKHIPRTNDSIPQDIADTAKAIGIDPPEQIKPTPNVGRPSIYDKATAVDILVDVATTADSIPTICTRFGINAVTFWRWMLINEQFCNGYLRALRNRSHLMGGDCISDITELENYCKNATIDARDKHARIQLFDKKWNKLQWLMAKYNPSTYGDRIQQDVSVTVQPAACRDQAWQLVQGMDIEDAETDDTPADDTP